MSWEDIGITIRIPPGAVAEGDKIDLAARPCLTGPFILPDGCKPASPPYLITCTPSYEFEKDVAVSLEHYVCLKTEDARKKMVFLSARAQPVRRGGQYQYQLRVVKGSRAVFGVEERVGTLSFKHFCVLQVGTTGKLWSWGKLVESSAHGKCIDMFLHVSSYIRGGCQLLLLGQAV